MKHAYVVALLLSGCAAQSYAYLEQVRSGTTIHLSLYSVEAPLSSSNYPRQWERYSRNGKPDDLVLKYSEGLVLVQEMRDLTALKRYADKNPEYVSPTQFPMSQPHLLCVRPAVWIDAAPEKSHGFFQHALLCVDPATRTYYELKVSCMTTRKGDVPPEALASMADHFFASFHVGHCTEKASVGPAC